MWDFANGTQDSELVGLWKSEDVLDVNIVFNRDGTGYLGNTNNGTDFEWATAEDNHLVIRTEGTEEGQIGTVIDMLSWTYKINGNKFTMESNQEQGVLLRFIKN